MKMRHLHLTSSAFALAVAIAIAQGCANTSDCGSLSTCAPASGGSAGAGGSAGTSGMSGTSGASGSSGSSGGSSGTSGEAGSGGDSGTDGGTPCDTTKTPGTESCLVSDKYGVFVAPTGNDGAPGTMDAPVKTIAKGVELATSASKFVVACDGTYDEQVTLTGSVTLYGGFKCPGAGVPWTYETGGKAKVAPIARGIALTIANASAAVDIEDFEFDAQDGMDAGESSIAAFVHDSTGVTLNRVKLVAGKGKDGANGVLTPITNFPSQLMLNGNPASGDTGGMAKLCMCGSASSKGGAGGNGGLNATGGGNGTPALSGGSPGAIGMSCASGGTGQDGAAAPSQAPASGATKLGTLSASGWTGADGTDGAPGTPGQGGGGGTGADTGGGGGGGGCGGCGGAGATAGKAGGSSIALLVFNTSVALKASTLVAGNAGKGGNGAAGQLGQTTGLGSAGAFAGDGCGGGKGGAGGAGGASGGAAGGISVGIVYQGTMAPSVDSSTMTTTGALGAKGLGGVPTTNDGIDGVKQDMLQVP